MFLMIAGLSVMGLAELFIDPVAMAQITRLNIPGATGVLTGIYMLTTGSIANYLAGIIAGQTAEDPATGASAQAYAHLFSQIGWWALGCTAAVIAVLAMWWLLTGRHLRAVNA